MSPASQSLPSRFSPTRIALNRAARRLFWPHPALYFPFGIFRKRGNVLKSNFDLYISGYPRSGNTFARTAFLSANPNVRVQSHRHIPSFDLRLVHRKIPGIVLLRTPLDAAISWAIHENQPIEEAIAYWNDFYRVLMPVRSQLFVATFEDVTTDFGAVMRAFNATWRTSYTPFDHSPENTARCFELTEEEHRGPWGDIRELRVCRPSEQRRAVKEAHLRELAQSKFLQDELLIANDLYQTFLHFRAKGDRQTSTRLVPEKQARPTVGVGAPV